VTGHQIMQSGAVPEPGETVSVVVVGDQHKRYGLVVDRFLGESMLVAQPLDQRLGKVKDIAACALLEDGSPVLIIDVDDMLRSVERLVGAGEIESVQSHSGNGGTVRRKRVLVVDD